MAVNDGEDVVEIVRDPAASWPMASIFCDWRNCSSNRRCGRDVTKQAEEQQRMPVQFNKRIGDFQYRHLALCRLNWR